MLFCAELSEGRLVHNILKAVTIKEFAILQPLEEGLKVTLDEIKSVEANVYIPSNLFISYNVEANEEVMFKINLKTFTDILNIFGDEGNASLKITYNDRSSPLKIIVHNSDENITVDCEMKTLTIEEFQVTNLSQECKLNKIVMKAEDFADILCSLDNLSDDLQVIFSDDPAKFSLKSTSLSTTSSCDLTPDDELVISYKCSENTDFSYAFSDIRHIFKAICFSYQIGVATGESGLLGMQLFIRPDPENPDIKMYVEYYVTSLFMTDD